MAEINKTTIIAGGINIAQDLIRAYNLQNINVLLAPKNNYQIDQTTQIDTALYLSSLGTPVMADLTFTGDSYIDENGNLVAFDTVTLETVLITIDQTKNIVKTAIQGRSGTVKEYIGMGDYMLKIDGLLTNVNGSYPKDQLTALKEMLTAPISIKVTSWYLQLFDIDYIVIDGFTVAQGEGSYSQQAFSIGACSDRDIQLVIQ